MSKDWTTGARSCAKCKYVQDFIPPYSNGSTPMAMQCRLNPPSLPSNSLPVQPQVDETMWCYQFSAKE